MANNALYTGVNREHERAKLTLVKRISKQKTRKDVAGLLQSALALATERQSHLCIKLLRRSFRAAFILEAKEIKATVKAHGEKGKYKVTSAAAATSPESITFDYSKVSTTHLNKVTRDTIGAAGTFNKGISKQLIAKYDDLVANNVLVNNIAKHGFTENAGAILLKQGISPEMVRVIQSQSTTTKMISILEQQGIRGGMHPNSVSKLLMPEIRAMFGKEGVIIDNVGKIRRELRTNAKGEYWFRDVKIVQPFKTTIKNYSSLISETSMRRAHVAGRIQSMKQSGIVKNYRLICQQTAASCCTCLSLHGTIVTAMLEPPLHPRCHCNLAPIYSDNSLNLHDQLFYDKQKSAGLFREFKFREYNAKLPRGEKLINANYLPAEELVHMPSGEKLQKMLDTLF
jgi:hypothetical protein